MWFKNKWKYFFKLNQLWLRGVLCNRHWIFISEKMKFLHNLSSWCHLFKCQLSVNANWVACGKAFRQKLSQYFFSEKFTFFFFSYFWTCQGNFKVSASNQPKAKRFSLFSTQFHIHNHFSSLFVWTFSFLFFDFGFKFSARLFSLIAFLLIALLIDS